MKYNWQMRYLKIPSDISSKLNTFENDDVIVSCVKPIGIEEIESGTYSHIGIQISDGEVVYKKSIVPDIKNGTRSKRNVQGHKIPIKEKGKKWKTYSFDAPNFGDWSKGSHEVSWDRKVYPQRKIPPRNLELTIDQIHRDNASDEYVFKFAVDKVYNKQSENYDEELLFAINLLQENVGVSDVFESDATLEDYLRTTTVNWEILPPGERETNIAKIISGMDLSSTEEKEIQDRYDYLLSLHPVDYIKGTSGFQRYFGARFDENLVVFENVLYGNAIYIMYGDWVELSKRSRTELLTDPNADYDRIVHTRNWKRNLIRKLQDRRPDLSFGQN